MRFRRSAVRCSATLGLAQHSLPIQCHSPVTETSQFESAKRDHPSAVLSCGVMLSSAIQGHSLWSIAVRVCVVRSDNAHYRRVPRSAVSLCFPSQGHSLWSIAVRACEVRFASHVSAIQTAVRHRHASLSIPSQGYSLRKNEVRFCEARCGRPHCGSALLRMVLLRMVLLGNAIQGHLLWNVAVRVCKVRFAPPSQPSRSTPTHVYALRCAALHSNLRPLALKDRG